MSPYRKLIGRSATSSWICGVSVIPLSGSTSWPRVCRKRAILVKPGSASLSMLPSTLAYDVGHGEPLGPARRTEDHPCTDGERDDLVIAVVEGAILVGDTRRSGGRSRTSDRPPGPRTCLHATCRLRFRRVVIAADNGQLEIGRVRPARVDHVLSVVLGNVIPDSGHDRPQRVLRADDEAGAARPDGKPGRSGAGRSRRPTISPGCSFSTRSKLCAGRKSVDNASSRCRAETRRRPLGPLYRSTDAPRSVRSCIIAP